MAEVCSVARDLPPWDEIADPGLSPLGHRAAVTMASVPTVGYLFRNAVDEAYHRLIVGLSSCCDTAVTSQFSAPWTPNDCTRAFHGLWCP